MNILIIGSDTNLRECKEKFGDKHQYVCINDQQSGKKHFQESEVVFDFTMARFPQQIEVYFDHPELTVFLNTSLISLHELGRHVDHKLPSTVFGFCGLPTFLNRPLLEVSMCTVADKAKLVEICKNLNTECVVVDDRIGLVTPRVICMIINEAYCTVEEGTATREDIDLAMKLGTNYPLGPFEWAKKIGIRNVYEVLNAVYEDTKDERYRICSLLNKESTLP